jgi:hypothetical protein
MIDNFALAHQLGLVFPPNVGYRIFQHRPKKRVRKPDGSFIKHGRLLQDKACRQDPFPPCTNLPVDV